MHTYVLTDRGLVPMNQITECVSMLSKLTHELPTGPFLNISYHDNIHSLHPNISIPQTLRQYSFPSRLFLPSFMTCIAPNMQYPNGSLIASAVC